MRKAMTALAAALVATGLAGGGPAQADPMSSDDARAQLFSPRQMVLQPLDMGAFSKPVRRAAGTTLDQLRSRQQMAKFLEAGYGYYGAVAFPVEGDGQAPPTIVSQLNSPEAAREAAVQTCQASTNGAACAVAALLLPQGYEARELTLSQAATVKVVENWDEGVLPKYLAFSPSTNAWGMAKGPGASARMAVESCKQADCQVVVADE